MSKPCGARGSEGPYCSVHGTNPCSDPAPAPTPSETLTRGEYAEQLGRDEASLAGGKLLRALYDAQKIEIAKKDARIAEAEDSLSKLYDDDVKQKARADAASERLRVAREALRGIVRSRRDGLSRPQHRPRRRTRMGDEAACRRHGSQACRRSSRKDEAVSEWEPFYVLAGMILCYLAGRIHQARKPWKWVQERADYPIERTKP